MARALLNIFNLANPIYRGATVTAYTVSGGFKTATKASLYADEFSTTTLANPQQLDSEGRFRQPVYIQDAAILTISGMTIPDHDTGIVNAAINLIGNANPRGVWQTGQTYAQDDLVEQGNSSYICVIAHTSGVFATDLAAGKWQSLGVLESVLAAPGGAAMVGFTATGTVAASNVQAAIAEVVSDLAAAGGSALVGFPPTGFVASATVQGAITEVVSELSAAGGAALVGFAPTGTIAAGTVQAAIAEVSGDVTALSDSSSILNTWINGNFEVWNESRSAVSCTAGAKTSGPEGWYVQPAGAAVTRARSTTVRTGARSRYSMELVGAASVTTVLVGQRTEAADIPAIARNCTFQMWIYNGSGAAFTPVLLVGTPEATDDFTTVTNRLTTNLQSCADSAWTLVSHTVDISGYTNLANGLQADFQIPSGSLVLGDTIRVMEPQLKPLATVSVLDYEPLPANQKRCERYYEKSFDPETAPASAAGFNGAAYWQQVTAAATPTSSPGVPYKVEKRVVPTLVGYNPGAAGAQVRNADQNLDCTNTTLVAAGTKSFRIGYTTAAGSTLAAANGIHWTANARLF